MLPPQPCGTLADALDEAIAGVYNGLNVWYSALSFDSGAGELTESAAALLTCSHERSRSTSKLPCLSVTRLCTACLEGKATRPHQARKPERGLRPSELTHTDLKGPLEPSYNHMKYIIHFTDDATRHVSAYAIERKSDAHYAFTRYLCELKAAGLVPRRLCSDNETLRRHKTISMLHSIPRRFAPRYF